MHAQLHPEDGQVPVARAAQIACGANPHRESPRAQAIPRCSLLRAHRTLPSRSPRGLTSGTLYYYRCRSGANLSSVGSFRTAYATDQDTPVTIGFTGDAHWAWKPYPLLASLVKEPLDTFVFLGDLLYESRNLERGSRPRAWMTTVGNTVRTASRGPDLRRA